MDRGGLQSGLKRRHVTMISLGGVIGAGLFVGSGAVINQTGPAAVLSYLAAGALVVLVMRMLGEMAVAQPEHGLIRRLRGAARSGNWARLRGRLAVLVLLGRSCSRSRRRRAPAIIQELAAGRADLGLRRWC